jgi:hypothetical protein
MRGREQIALLTARLRSDHHAYENASESWSPGAVERKKELRKSREGTLVEIGAALKGLGEEERLQEIDRLPFEQKLAQLAAFLEDTSDESTEPLPEGDGADGSPPAAKPAILPAAKPAVPPPAKAAVLPPADQAVPRAASPVVSPAAAPAPSPPASDPGAVALTIETPFVPHPEPESSAPGEPLRAIGEATRLGSMPPVSLPLVPLPPLMPHVSLRPVSLRPASMRLPSRRPIGHWPVRLAPALKQRAARWRVPVIACVAAVHGLALVVLSIAALRVTHTPQGCAESEPSHAATSNAMATAMAAPLPPPATPPANAGVLAPLSESVLAGEARSAAAGAAQTPRRAVSPARPSAGSKAHQMGVAAAKRLPHELGTTGD